MSEGLKALEYIKHKLSDLEYAVVHNPQITAPYIEETNWNIIKQELEEKETQDDYIKMLEDRIDNLETSYLRNKKALDILISLFDIKIVGGYLIARRGETCLVYNLILKQNQEIINSLKEVLDYE